MVKSGQIFENSRRIVGYLTRIFGNMDDFTGFVADLFLTRQPLGHCDCIFISEYHLALVFLDRCTHNLNPSDAILFGGKISVAL